VERTIKKELSDLYSLPSIIRMINSTRIIACSTNGGEKLIEVIDGKARKKETTRKTKRYM
jgi:hypothetical protein